MDLLVPKQKEIDGSIIYCFFKNKFTYFIILNYLSVCCCLGAFSSCEQGLLFVAAHRLLIPVTSPIAEHGL